MRDRLSSVFRSIDSATDLMILGEVSRFVHLARRVWMSLPWLRAKVGSLRIASQSFRHGVPLRVLPAGGLVCLVAFCRHVRAAAPGVDAAPAVGRCCRDGAGGRGREDESMCRPRTATGIRHVDVVLVQVHKDSHGGAWWREWRGAAVGTRDDYYL